MLNLVLNHGLMKIRLDSVLVQHLVFFLLGEILKQP